MVKLKRNSKFKKDKQTQSLSGGSRSEISPRTDLYDPRPQKPQPDPLGAIYLLLALIGFGAAAYVLCLATPVLAVGALLICIFFFAGKRAPPADATVEDDGQMSQATTVTGL